MLERLRLDYAAALFLYEITLFSVDFKQNNVSM